MVIFGIPNVIGYLDWINVSTYAIHFHNLLSLFIVHLESIPSKHSIRHDARYAWQAMCSED